MWCPRLAPCRPVRPPEHRLCGHYAPSRASAGAWADQQGRAYQQWPSPDRMGLLRHSHRWLTDSLRHRPRNGRKRSKSSRNLSRLKRLEIDRRFSTPSWGFPPRAVQCALNCGPSAGGLPESGRRRGGRARAPAKGREARGNREPFPGIVPADARQDSCRPCRASHQRLRPWSETVAARSRVAARSAPRVGRIRGCCPNRHCQIPGHGCPRLWQCRARAIRP